MNGTIEIFFSFMAGVGLGSFFFGGLWLTVRAVPKVKAPILLSIGSLLARMGVSILIFYLLVRGGDWLKVMPCVLGFILVKFSMVALSKRLPAGARTGLKGRAQ